MINSINAGSAWNLWRFNICARARLPSSWLSSALAPSLSPQHLSSFLSVDLTQHDRLCLYCAIPEAFAAMTSLRSEGPLGVVWLCPPVYTTPSIYWSTTPSICLSTTPSIYLSTIPSIYLSTTPSICICLPPLQSVCLPPLQSICPPSLQSICLTPLLSFYLPPPQFICTLADWF